MPKKIFYTGIIIISVFEVMNVYFIMPMPGSQGTDSIDTAYFLYSNRWYFRIFAGILIASSIIPVVKNKPLLVPAIVIVTSVTIIYIFNFNMNAESMFKQPEKLILKTRAENNISDSSIVICVENGGEVKAYPVRYLSYHHQVQDSVGNLSLLITYCNVCRTGRVYIPQVKGQPEKFRLVGMDQYNAMLEDAGTKSWWRQATGEAIAGPQQGEILPEVKSIQLTVRKLFELYPHALVMQPDKAALKKYDISGKFEQGKSTGRLTRTDTLSWKEKSWIIGIRTGSESKAYDWNYLKNQRIINDKIGSIPIIIILSVDGQSFAAFERPEETKYFFLKNDTLVTEGEIYDFSGNGLGTTIKALTRINAYQEFWHSWQTFNPGSQIFK